MQIVSEITVEAGVLVDVLADVVEYFEADFVRGLAPTYF